MSDERTYSAFVPSSAAFPAPVEGAEGVGGTDIPDVLDGVVDVPTEGTVEVVVVEELINRLIEIVGTPQEVPNFMETPFTEYGVTDGLLLLLLLFSFLSALWNLVKGVF